MKFSKYKLGELLRVTRGASLPGTGYADEGRYLRLTLANFLEEGGFKYFKSTQGKYFVEAFDNRFLMHKGDLITPLTEQSPGLLGSVAFIPCDDLYIQSQDVGLITCNSEKLDKTFAYYLFLTRSVREQISARSQQTKIRHTSPDKIADVEVFLPDLPTQLRIAGVLGSLDEKIELNRRKIAELEALAKTIYDYWFVQFDFPDKNGKPYKSSGGKMVWNEKLKREIPAGWEVEPLEKACKRIQSGGTPESNNEAFYSGDIPWFTTQELIDSWVFCSNRSITKSALENSAAKLFPPDTVLLAIYAAPTVGRLAILAKESAFNQACCGFVVGDDISKEYLFLFLYENRNKLNSIADGTAQKNLSVGKMRMFDVLIPTGEIMTLWRNIAEPLFDAIRTDSETAHILSRQRDALLPLLMNGQISVRELK